MRVLTVSEVRRHLYWADGGPGSGGAGAASIALLGRSFHELYATLTGPDEHLNMTRPLELADATVESWQRTLLDHAFVSIVAPVLARHESVLQANAQEVLGFWTATRELCVWLAGILHSLHAADAQRSLESWRREIFTAAEVDLVVEFTDPTWPESIQLQGRADAVLTSPGLQQRCIVELKLGRTHPSADLLQGCLYQWILAHADASLGDTALAVVSFEPGRHEQLFEARALQTAQVALKAVLAELVGFNQPSPPRTPRHGTEASIGIAPMAPDRLQELKRKLSSAFAEYGAPLDIAQECLCGPAFVRFFATPRRGVAARRVVNLVQNVWMRLGTSQPPQVSLDAGRVVIDVQRLDRQPVDFADWRSSIQAQTKGRSAAFAVGLRVDGKLHIADLAESQSPHLLVVGTTGSGKSEWLRAFLASLMATNTPQTLRFALMDPKRLAFSALEGSAFLWRPIVYDDGAIELFDALIEEMEARYMMLQQCGVDDLAGYHASLAPQSSPCPRIVCICDEFADLLLQDKKTREEIEGRVSRLGVKGRAAGVHLVFATQRAGREVLKGTIDSNLPGRVALTVARDGDSRMILGEPGAETLLGKGDLLYKDIGSPIRLQGLRVTKDELDGLSRGA